MTDDQKTAVTGVFESDGRGGGFLRGVAPKYETSPDDVFVSAATCRSARLRAGHLVAGTWRRMKGRGSGRRGRELAQVDTIEGRKPEECDEVAFEKLTPIDPERQVHFETSGGPSTMRIVDLLTPIGFGQRGLIVAPPRTGKTILLQQMAQAVAANYPDVHVVVLLVDERPEEVTDMRRTVPAEVVASSNDKDAKSHIRLAKLAIERARRMVECGRDVFLLLDSLTRLGRGFNTAIRGGGRIMSGGLDIGALTEPKSIFGAARNIEEGGSLTIVASALIETGSRMDDVIFNEFKGTGNMEIMLSREMADRRVFPAIDLNPSGTRKEERLLTPEVLAFSHSFRRASQGRSPIQVMEQLLAMTEKYATNAELVEAAGASSRSPVR